MGDNKYMAFRCRDGKPVYESPFQGSCSEASLQVVDGKYVLRTPFPHQPGPPAYPRFDKVDFTKEKSEGGEAWVKNDLQGSFATWLIHEGYFYGLSWTGAKGESFILCLEVSTGKEIWRQKTGLFQWSIMLADGLLFVRLGTELWLVEATPKGFSLKGKADLKIEEGPWASWAACNAGWVMPSLAYGRLYLRSQTELICLQAAEKLPAVEDVLRAATPGKDGKMDEARP